MKKIYLLFMFCGLCWLELSAQPIIDFKINPFLTFKNNAPTVVQKYVSAAHFAVEFWLKYNKQEGVACNQIVYATYNSYRF